MPEYDSSLINKFLSSGAGYTEEGDDDFAARSANSARQGVNLFSIYQNAQSDLATKRNFFLQDFGLDKNNKADPDAQFGTYQNTLRGTGSQLDSLLQRGQGRGLGLGGLARSGINLAEDQADDQISGLRAQGTRARLQYDLNEGDNRRAFGSSLLGLDAADLAQKHENELYGDGGLGTPVSRVESPAADTETADDGVAEGTEGADDQTSPEMRAATFARKQIKRANKLGIGKFPVPKEDDAKAAAKWRKISAGMSPYQQKRMKNQRKRRRAKGKVVR